MSKQILMSIIFAYHSLFVCCKYINVVLKTRKVKNKHFFHVSVIIINLIPNGLVGKTAHAIMNANSNTTRD